MEFPASFETQEDFDKAVSARLKREREKFADYDELKARVAEYEAATGAPNPDLEKAQTEIKKLKDAAAARDKADELSKLRAKVAKEAGVPAELVSGDDEDSMRAWAKSLADFARPKAPKTSKAGSFDDGATGDEDAAKKALARQIFGGDE